MLRFFFLIIITYQWILNTKLVSPTNGPYNRAYFHEWNQPKGYRVNKRAKCDVSHGASEGGSLR